MDLTPHVEALQRDLAAAAAAGTEETRRVADLLAGALEPAARLTLLDALAEIAAEVTEALDGPTVEVRLQGREPRVVVTAPAPEPEPEPAARPAGEPGWTVSAEDSGTVRITLRLPEPIKTLLDEAAATESMSVNTWLVRIITRALDHHHRPPPFQPPANPLAGRRITGYARG